MTVIDTPKRCGFSFLIPTYDARKSRTFLQSHNEPLGIVADIGCNNGEKGVFHRKFAKYMIGIDLDKQALKEGENIYDDVVMADGQSLPFREGAFDGVFAFHVIEHVPLPDNLLSEICRTLKQKGLALVITPNRRRINSLLYKRIKGIDEFVYPLNPDHVTEFTDVDLLRLLSHQRRLLILKFERIGFIRVEAHCFTISRCPSFFARFCDQFFVALVKTEELA